MKYRIVKRIFPQYGNKCYVFVISKKTWLGFYIDTNEYYFWEDSAQRRCDYLNKLI